MTGSDNCCDSDHSFYWFRREADGRFGPRRAIGVKVGDEKNFFLESIRVALADWDGDGQIDVISSLRGLHHTKGPWSAEAGEIHATERVDDEANGQMTITQPIVVDWDRDGRPDLLTATWEPSTSSQIPIYQVTWSRNLGATGRIRLDPPCTILRLAASEPDRGTQHGGLGW